MKHFLLILVLALLVLPLTGQAQRVDSLPETTGTEDKIVAIVNDNVISTADVNARVKLALLSSGLPDTPDVRHRLLPQIVRGLIDEQLQLQEAKRLDISVQTEEINQSLERIAHDNNIMGDMKTYIAERGGSPEALAAQVKAGLSWSKVVQRELRPRVEVGDDEINAVIERMRANAGKEEYLVSEVLLAVDSPKDEDQVRQLAENLVQKLKEGANFAAIARQFSQSTGAASGGDIGWIQEGQLQPELNRALTTMEAGEIKGPVRSASGYHILGVREKRTVALSDPKEIALHLEQAFRPFDPSLSKESLSAEANQLRASINSCDTLQSRLTQKFPAWRWQDMGDVKLAKAPTWVTDRVKNVPVGGSGEPLATNKGALVLFVCGRTIPMDNINRDAILNSIGTEKLELQARRLLRDLRRGAYLDIRMSSLPS